MVKVKSSNTRSDTSKKGQKTPKNERKKEYERYLRSKQFAEVKRLVLERQDGLCPVCGDPIDSEHPGSCHHRDYRFAGMGGEIEAAHCVYIHTYEHNAIHRSKASYRCYSVLNDRNEPDPENHSDLANSIRKERNTNKK